MVLPIGDSNYNGLGERVSPQPLHHRLFKLYQNISLASKLILQDRRRKNESVTLYRNSFSDHRSTNAARTFVLN